MPTLTLPEGPVAKPPAPLTHAQILRLYTPLALSWVFMAIEGPSTTAIIGRLPHRELNSAALLVLLGLSMWIESPVIDLLSTATTLAKSRQHYAQLSRYTWGLICWVTIAHATLVLTPIYWFVTLRILSLPADVAHQARMGMVLLIPWAGFIGWRRYLQGILIRFHRTRLISLGTFMRVSTMSIVGWCLFAFSGLPSIVIAGCALISSVAAESLCIHIASRATIRREFGGPTPKDQPSADIGFAPSELAESPLTVAAIPDSDNEKSGGIEGSRLPTLGLKTGGGTSPGHGAPNAIDRLTLKKLLAFHMPLTATTMVALVGGPLISAALSKSYSPVLSLASWQVVATLVWLCRTIEFALPEVIITLYKDSQSAAMLRQFSIRVGVTISSIMALMAITGGDRVFFGTVLGENPPTVAMAHLAFLCAITLPLIGCQQNYIKGMLTAHHLTPARFLSALVSFSTLILMLLLGVSQHWIGVVTAAVALNVSLLGEVGVLFWFWRNRPKSATSL